MFIQRFFKIQNYCFASQTVLLDILSCLTVNQQKQETNTSKVARLGHLDNIFSRPRPSLAVRR